MGKQVTPGWQGAARLHTLAMSGLVMVQGLGSYWASLYIAPGPSELLWRICRALGMAVKMCGVNREV